MSDADQASADPAPIVSHPLRLADLPQRKATRVVLSPDEATLRALADALGVDALRKLRFEATLEPLRGADWRLTGRLGATVEQPCRVSLAPVKTRVDEAVTRHYVADWAAASEDEAEMPEDDTVEPLGAVIDMGAVMEEALALAIPSYPRAEGVEDLSIVAGPPGALPLDDDAVKPFAGLAALKAKMEGGSES